MLVAPHIRFGVLALEVKNIDGETYVIEKGVAPYHFRECAVVVVENMIWLQARYTVYPLNHFLIACQYIMV